MAPDDLVRLRHILDAALEAQEFMQDVRREDLPRDRKTAQAVIRNLEVIGEAAAKLSGDVTAKHPELPWKEMVGMRNWLIHAYFDIDYDHIWNTVHVDLPALIPLLRNLIKEQP